MNALLLLVLLACPLMMVFMMRGMHAGHGGNAEDGHTHGGRGRDHPGAQANVSLDELRRRRDQLDRQIAECEAAEQTPIEEDAIPVAETVP